MRGKSRDSVSRLVLLASVAMAGLAHTSASAAPLEPSSLPAPEHVLYAFAGGSADGADPGGSVVRDASGNLYGTTFWGGSAGCTYGYGCGTVFKIDASGNETILYKFTGGSDGGNPNGGVILDSNGNLYGTASFGGNTACSFLDYVGCGVVFKLDPAGTETILYAFSGPDGASPGHERLLADSAGNLYGTTEFGGDLACKPTQGLGCGVVFRLSAKRKYTVLHAFRGTAKDGYVPESGVVRDNSGNLFGETSYGGAYDQGIVYKLPTGGTEKVLHSFTGGADGGYPTGGELALAPDGRLYGTAAQGGNMSACSSVGCGVVFSMTPRGQESVLYAFQNGVDGSTDGAYPREGVVLDSVGNIFGAAQGGGADGFGILFEIAKRPSGAFAETVLHEFTGGADGAYPSGGNLIVGPGGRVYGAAEYGGDSNCPQSQPKGCGVVFRLKP